MTHGRGFGNDHGEHNGAPLSHDTTDTPDRTDTVDVTASPQDVYAAESTATKVLRVSRSHVSGAAAGLLAVTAVTSGVLTVGATDVAPPTSMPTVAATSPAEQSAAPSDVSTTAAGVAGLPGMDPLAAAQLVSAAMSATGANTGEPASVVRAAPVSGVIPQRMVEAYQRGEAVAAQRAPQCNMPWWLLAGIGRVESGHAAGGAVDANGVTVTRILGPRLDGTTPDTAVITDTDGGRFDGDPHYDRAVGPMQFIPGTWVLAGVDGNGDGTANPSQVDDAAASAAMYLCSGGGDMSNPADMASAILRYNNSTQYVQDVLAGATAYRDGHVPVTPPRKIQAAPETSQTTTQAAKGAPAPSSAARPGQRGGAGPCRCRKCRGGGQRGVVPHRLSWLGPGRRREHRSSGTRDRHGLDHFTVHRSVGLGHHHVRHPDRSYCRVGYCHREHPGHPGNFGPVQGRAVHGCSVHRCSDYGCAVRHSSAQLRPAHSHGNAVRRGRAAHLPPQRRAAGWPAQGLAAARYRLGQRAARGSDRVYGAATDRARGDVHQGCGSAVDRHRCCRACSQADELTVGSGAERPGRRLGAGHTRATRRDACQRTWWHVPVVRLAGVLRGPFRLLRGSS